MAAPEDTRRCLAQKYMETHPDVQWVAHPMGTNEPEFRLMPAEVLHCLPCCDGPGETTVEKVRMIVNTDTLNVRVAPALDAEKTAQLKRGAEVLVVAGTDDWARLIEPHGGRYVYRSLLRPT